ncbi:MAG: imidazoleglycerol-phosphate dehydratase [Deltaproteobacteria bacterium]|nr:MAG: imidazoleglycerol-phosphate dehydratase [Deltaproteobacteria bacterium]
MAIRHAHIERVTNETGIEIDCHVDGTGTTSIRTGYGFADHMLDLMGFWARFDLEIHCRGDYHIDAHHSIEDIGLVLGEALHNALGDKAGIARVGWAKVPMDEALTEVVVDISGRPYLVYQETDLPPIIAGQEKDLWREFFKSFAMKAGINLHIHILYGMNGHHMLESVFKGLGLALRQALTPTQDTVFSTKGVLDS